MSLTDKDKKKRCSKCGEIRLLSEFYKDGETKFGVMSQCKYCKREYFKKRYQKNKDEIKLRNVARRKMGDYCKIKEALVPERYCKYICNENFEECKKRKNEVFRDFFNINVL